MLKCKICGTEFPAVKDRHYITRDDGKVGLEAAFGSNPEEKLHDTFDCPMCGCQVVVQDRKREYVSFKSDSGMTKPTDGAGEDK